MMTRDDVVKDYDLGEDGRVTSPGKFEGEPWWTVALWDSVMNGFYDDDTGSDGDYTHWFRIDDELRAVFGVDSFNGGKWVTVWERDDGFVCHDLPDYGPEDWSAFVPQFK